MDMACPTTDKVLLLAIVENVYRTLSAGITRLEVILLSTV